MQALRTCPCCSGAKASWVQAVTPASPSLRPKQPCRRGPPDYPVVVQSKQARRSRHARAVTCVLTLGACAAEQHKRGVTRLAKAPKRTRKAAAWSCLWQGFARRPAQGSCSSRLTHGGSGRSSSCRREQRPWCCRGWKAGRASARQGEWRGQLSWAFAAGSEESLQRQACQSGPQRGTALPWKSDSRTGFYIGLQAGRRLCLGTCDRTAGRNRTHSSGIRRSALLSRGWVRRVHPARVRANAAAASAILVRGHLSQLGLLHLQLQWPAYL